MKRSKHSLSHTHLTSCDMGELIPIGHYEVLPGDSIQQATNMLVRAAPLLAPVMHPVDCRIHHFFVPYRLLWDDFENFITGGPDGMDNTDRPWKLFNASGVGTLADYLGLPTGTAFTAPIECSMLPFRAYAMIWNEYYRDQDLETPLVISTASGPDTTTSITLQNCDWEKDYFTSSRPWEQKGPAITIPLGTTAPVVYKHVAANSTLARLQTTGAVDVTAAATLSKDAAGAMFKTGGATGWQYDPNGTLETNLSAASAITINLLREAMALQRFEEARARFGSRYVEYLRYLGVQSSDARLQRPEYLGGGRQTIQFSEVLQTAPTTSGNEIGVGDLKGHGIAGMRSNRFRRYFEEHGIVISLFSVRPKTIYMQGIHRSWSRLAKEDYWQRELEAIGQQEVLNKEVYGAHTTRDAVFGYQDRYDEYRRQESRVSGEFRTTTLNHWHLARDFSSSPALNATFVKSVPTERIFAVPTEDVLYVMAKHSIQARRLVAQTGRSFIL